MICEECKKLINLENGVCTNCGLVFEDHPISYDLGFSKNEEESEKSPSFISWDSPDISYATLHSKKTHNPELKRAFKIENQNGSYLYGRSYINAYVEIKRICIDMGLSETIRQNATYWLRLLLKKGYIQKSYKKYACYAALIILVARSIFRLPVKFTEMIEHSDENIKDIKKAYGELRRELKIASNPFYLFEIVQYHCNKIGIFNAEQKKYVEFAKNVKIVSGRDLYGYSAAIIKMMTRKTRKDISKLLDVSEPVITARERELRKI